MAEIHQLDVLLALVVKTKGVVMNLVELPSHVGDRVPWPTQIAAGKPISSDPLEHFRLSL